MNKKFEKVTAGTHKVSKETVVRVTMQRTMVTAKGQRDSVTLQNHYLCEKKEIILHCKIRDNQIVKVKIQTSIL